MRELKRCPKCGEMPSLGLDDAFLLYYTCVPCAISAEGGDTVDEARRLWNKLIRKKKADGI